MTAEARILIVDDEPAICINCQKILSKANYHVEYALNGYDALKMMENMPFDVVVTDLKMTRMGGMEVLSRISEAFSDTQVIVITGHATVSSAVEVMKMGAFDYLPKPFTPDELRAVVRQALEDREVMLQNQRFLGQPPHQRPLKHRLVGESPEIKKVVSMVGKVAPTDATVLVSGESGTGKELIARAVHANSNRREKSFFCGRLRDPGRKPSGE